MCGIERWVWLPIMGSLVWPLPAPAEPQWLLQANASAKATTTHRPLRPDIRLAQRDPFQMAPVTASVPPLPPVVVSPVMEVAPPQPVMPPPPTLAYVGRMRAVHGGWLVMAQLGADGFPVALVVGKELGNGYRVERMSDHVVELLNPHTQNVMQLAVPAVPRFETW